MVKFKNLLERLNLRAVAKKSTIDSRHSSVGRRPTDAWSTLERLIKRGLPEDVVAWRQDPEVQKSILQLPGVDIDRGAGGGGGGGEGGSESEEGENETDGTKEKVDEGKEEIKRLGSDGGFVNLSCNLFQEQMNIPRYLHRSSDFSDMICVTPLQLAVIESKVDVVLALLLGLTEDQLYRAVTTQASIIRKDENSTPAPVGKKSFAETRKFFSVSTISGSRVEMEPRSEQQLDWKDTKEWTTLHLAVMYDIECLKVLLYLLEKEGSPARVEEVLDARNSKGRTVLHLAARSPISSTSTRLLLDLGVQVDCTDEYGLTPLHMAVKFGVLDTVRILLQQGGDKSNGGLDINGRSLLHHSSSVEITRYLLRRGFSPDLSTLKYQTRKGGIDNVRLFLDDTFIRRDNLLILDFSLAMEQDRDGDLGTDGESVFLRNFLSHRKLLRAPLAESLLWMKWFASKRAILLDLFFYFIFISCLTGVICSSTHRGGGVERKLSKPESAIVDLVLANYRGELKRRGWRFLPRSRPNVDTMINISDNISHPLGSSLFNSATLSSLSPLASPASSTVSPSAPRSAEKLLITAGKSVTFLGFYSFTVILSAVFLLRDIIINININIEPPD
ncbi:uncharacterized protein LOC111701632 [Eurytemora carolleeae]|uniref:uncharacterized protein LOC111701632 n=1 Tax=Eurytemora carolleeae TaxID=1294199 RepID=UPI000C76F0E7|nr:uncharacterized protein LOC111701632 [Eurytemora carolleeae]|eukprot:XP_023328773.1 uncharacterized protein LOC111701632 [Eurytemora affinis]